jgi:tripeptidyl-peptidase-1
MRSAFLYLVLAILPFAALASTARAHSYSLKEEVPVPRGWTRGPRASPTHHIDLRIGLPQGEFAALESHLWEISDRACDH